MMQEKVRIIARVDRMKEAKSEAESAVAAYRAEMEAEFQKNAVSLNIGT